MKRQNVQEWIKCFNNGDYNDYSRNVQIEAGWYDWFCSDWELKLKTMKMGEIISKIKDGKINLKSTYVWFKNCCPCSYPLYDDFRFADIVSGDVIYTTVIDCGYDNKKYAVYGRSNDFVSPLFETNMDDELINWFNTPGI